MSGLEIRCVMAKKSIFKISFISNGNVYEVYAKSVGQSSIFGFIEIAELLFNSKSKVVLDPSEERLKNEFNEVKKTYVPLHSILRIDEVEKEGTAKVISTQESGKITPFPSTIYNK